MSNRQARREQMRTTRQERTARQQPSGARRTGPPRLPGAPRGSGGRGLLGTLTQPFVLIVVAVVLALGAILGVIIATDDGGDKELGDMLRAGDAAFPYELTNGFKVGRDDAPLKITAYEDFQCPFCLGYSAREEPTIVEEYVKTGKVQLIFANLPILGQESLAAAKAGVCAAQQNKFWQLQHRLFIIQADAGQATAEKVDAGRMNEAKLKEYASELGLDRTAFDACFADEATLAEVQQSLQDATSFGFRSTPSYLFNDTPFGSGSPGSVEGWRRVIDDALNQIANPSPTSSASNTASPSPAGSASPAATATTPAATATAAQ